jgi:hypothetical protein
MDGSAESMKDERVFGHGYPSRPGRPKTLYPGEISRIIMVELVEEK